MPKEAQNHSSVAQHECCAPVTIGVKYGVKNSKMFFPVADLIFNIGVSERIFPNRNGELVWI